MPELTPSIVAEVLSTCQATAGEAAEALSRALDQKLTLAVGESGQLQPDALPEELSGPGLAVVLTIGGVGAILALPEATGFVPEWCAAPDPTGQSKLTTLAQELSMTLLPEAYMADDFKAARVKNLAGALARGSVESSAAYISFTVSSDDGKTGKMWLVWPIPKPAMVIGANPPKLELKPEPKAEPKTEPKAHVEKPAASPAVPAPKSGTTGGRSTVIKTLGLRELPTYTKSLLHIRVPVTVTLAEKRQPLGRIIELSPGMILQFEKSCDQALDLEVGDQKVAAGEAVKIGDKFGLRITSITLPDERFSTWKAEP